MDAIRDVPLAEVDFLPLQVVDDLALLEIRTLRQLGARMRAESEALREYLELDGATWEAIRSQTSSLLAECFPDDGLQRSFPSVNRRGVAVHRLGERRRPRFRGDD
ncbi:MAG: hypothetical protein D6696_06800 [Acidobacteria bacterium]|nr:MAG: hypothetical protein D6696_06800 [Acidobacteriota bacterium]